jgi:hypothetical protein
VSLRRCPAVSGAVDVKGSRYLQTMNHTIFVSDGKLYQVFFWGEEAIVAVEYLNQFNEWIPVDENFRRDMVGW